MLACRRANPLAAAGPTPAPRVDRGRALLCPRVGGVRACTLPLAPARRRLHDNNFGDDAKQALKAAAGSGLEMYL